MRRKMRRRRRRRMKRRMRIRMMMRMVLMSMRRMRMNGRRMPCKRHTRTRHCSSSSLILAAANVSADILVST